MSSIDRLTDLSALTSMTMPPERAVGRAVVLLQEALSASDIFLIYGSGAGFRHFGTRPNLDLTDVSLWLINHDLASRGEPCAFDLREGRVVAFRNIGSRRPCDYVAAAIPMAAPAGEMLVARGPWSRGLRKARTHYLRAALPTLALILERRLDSSRAERQRNLLSALANVTRVMSESEDLETVLTSIARTIASVTGVHYVSIDIVDKDGKIKLRCLNSEQRIEELVERWRRGASKPDPVRDAVLNTGQPMLFPDAQNDERIPESGRNFFIRTLIRSTAVFPLIAKDEVVGVLSVASHRPLKFLAHEVELLEGFAAQVAGAIKGIQLYQELAESREELQRLNEQLQESMGIEHHLARTDALTGIPNRRFIDETIEAECARARRYGQALSVVMADVDRLKVVNDTYGHNAGDEMLRYVAGLARESCRQVDVVGRYGGDEFVFVLPTTGAAEAVIVGERFRQHLAEHPATVWGDVPVHLTASLGVAQWDGKLMEEPSCLIRLADRAMYEAKTAGGNRTAVAPCNTAHAA